MSEKTKKKIPQKKVIKKRLLKGVIKKMSDKVQKERKKWKVKGARGRGEGVEGVSIF